MKAAMIGLILSAALLAAAMIFCPDWLAPGSRPEPPAAHQVGEILHAPDPRIALLARRKGAKEEVGRRLFDGELTLLEAAEEFYHLNGCVAGLDDIGVQAQPGGDEGERLCNQAISWAGAVMLHVRPRAEVTARIAVLQRELREHVAIHGGFRLSAAEE
jgi:hypothetical protein